MADEPIHPDVELGLPDLGPPKAMKRARRSLMISRKRRARLCRSLKGRKLLRRRRRSRKDAAGQASRGEAC